MTDHAPVGVVVAFVAGLFSFVSPCVLPLFPSYITFVTGISLEEAKGAEGALRTRILAHSLAFIFGFSAVFIALGAGATLVGGFVQERQELLRRVGGVLIVLFGASIAGIFKIPFLEQEHKLHVRKRPVGLVGAFLVGMAFAAGWTPCIGPILGSIMALALTSEKVGRGVLLLGAYSAGLGIPFLLSSLALGTFLAGFRRFQRYIGPFNVACGIFLMVVGVLIFTNYFTLLSGLLSRWTPSFLQGA